PRHPSRRNLISEPGRPRPRHFVPPTSLTATSIQRAATNSRLHQTIPQLNFCPRANRLHTIHVSAADTEQPLSSTTRTEAHEDQFQARVAATAFARTKVRVRLGRVAHRAAAGPIHASCDRPAHHGPRLAVLFGRSRLARPCDSAYIARRLPRRHRGHLLFAT